MPYPPSIKYMTDVHCHPTDMEITDQAMENLSLKVVTMATRVQDQQLVADLASRWPEKVVPCFGFHPWFTHTIALQDPPPPKLDHYAPLFLPGVPVREAMSNSDFAKLFESLVDPIPLSQIISSVRSNFEKHSNAMLGEVGLDRTFRIPFVPLYSEGMHEDDEDQAHNTTSAHSPRLSPFHVPLEHQLAILEAQISLAIEFKRNVSMHSVKAQQASVDLLKRLVKQHGDQFHAISLDFHSCGLSAEMWGDIQKTHSNVFLSLSTAINTRSPAHIALIKACDDSRMLVESDYPTITQTAQRTWDMVEIIAGVKGWEIEQTAEEVVQEPAEGTTPGAVRRFMLNWERFSKGGHRAIPFKASNKVRKRNKFPHAEEDWQDADGEIGTVVY